jgi:hypothetical protein
MYAYITFNKILVYFYSCVEGPGSTVARREPTER